MKEKAAHLVLLADTSISQAGKEKKIYDTYLSVSEKFKMKHEKCFITLGLFSDRLEMFFCGSSAVHTRNARLGDFSALGPTRLYDAAWKILEAADGFNDMLRDDMVIENHFYIISDGKDTASAYLGEDDFLKMVRFRRKNGWTVRLIDSSGRRIPEGINHRKQT